MKVYIVTSGDGGSGGFFAGAYSTKEKAEAAVKWLRALPARQHDRIGYDIEEFELDGEPYED